MVENIAAVRRDKVSALKKVFIFIKIGVMLLLSVLGSMYFIWSMFYNQVNLKRNPNPTIADCMKYVDGNIFLVISATICCVVACCFIGFLLVQAIQHIIATLVMHEGYTLSKTALVLSLLGGVLGLPLDIAILVQHKSEGMFPGKKMVIAGAIFAAIWIIALIVLIPMLLLA